MRKLRRVDGARALVPPPPPSQTLYLETSRKRRVAVLISEFIRNLRKRGVERNYGVYLAKVPGGAEGAGVPRCPPSSTLGAAYLGARYPRRELRWSLRLLFRPSNGLFLSLRRRHVRAPPIGRARADERRGPATSPLRKASPGSGNTRPRSGTRSYCPLTDRPTSPRLRVVWMLRAIDRCTAMGARTPRSADGGAAPWERLPGRRNPLVLLERTRATSSLTPLPFPPSFSQGSWCNARADRLMVCAHTPSLSRFDHRSLDYLGPRRDPLTFLWRDPASVWRVPPLGSVLAMTVRRPHNSAHFYFPRRGSILPHLEHHPLRNHGRPCSHFALLCSDATQPSASLQLLSAAPTTRHRRRNLPRRALPIPRFRRWRASSIGTYGAAGRHGTAPLRPG